MDKKTTLLTLEQQEAISKWLKDTVAFPENFDKHFIEKFGRLSKEKHNLQTKLNDAIDLINRLTLEASLAHQKIVEAKNALRDLKKMSKKINTHLKKLG